MADGTTEDVRSESIDIAETVGTDISSRGSAADLRAHVTRAFANNWRDTFTLDFTRVRTISHCWADEFFGVLAHYHGSAWFRSRIIVYGLSAENRKTVAESIVERITKSMSKTLS